MLAVGLNRDRVGIGSKLGRISQLLINTLKLLTTVIGKARLDGIQERQVLQRKNHSTLGIGFRNEI